MRGGTSPVEGGSRGLALDGIRIHEFFAFEASEGEICASGGAAEVSHKAVNRLCEPYVAVKKTRNDGIPACLARNFTPLYTTAFGEEFLYHGLNCFRELNDMLPGREDNAPVSLAEFKESVQSVSVCADRPAGGDVVALAERYFTMSFTLPLYSSGNVRDPMMPMSFCIFNFLLLLL